MLESGESSLSIGKFQFELMTIIFLLVRNVCSSRKLANIIWIELYYNNNKSEKNNNVIVVNKLSLRSSRSQVLPDKDWWKNKKYVIMQICTFLNTVNINEIECAIIPIIRLCDKLIFFIKLILMAVFYQIKPYEYVHINIILIICIILKL